MKVTTNWRNLTERAGWTFVQAFGADMTLSELVGTLLSIDTDARRALIVAGGAAFLSALKEIARERLADLRAADAS